MNTENKLEILPIGGISHVTQNMYLYRYEKEIVLIDCGIGFPDLQMPGVDILIPDINYLLKLLESGHKIVGMILSHGHDDHIGALPYILPNLPEFPIYASKLTAGFANNRLLDGGSLREVKVIPDRKTITLSENFQFTLFAMTHSVPDTKHILLDTPVGKIYHGSDFKLDHHPVGGVLPDYEFIEQLSQQDIKLMLTDCLGVEKSTWTQSESTVGPQLEKEMADVKGKCIITLMSSHIDRIIQILHIAHKMNRKVAFIGRSVEQNVITASELGFINDEYNVIINKKEIKNHSDDQLILIVAGSQGQEGSSLVRAIYGAHREIQINSQDKVIFSADAIPGNEITYYGAIDELSINNVSVVYPVINPGVHQSGHARRPELIDLLSKVKPKKVFPIGGNNRHRALYRDLVAVPLNYQLSDIILPEEGDIIGINGNGEIRKTSNVNLRPQIVDGLGIGDVGPVVLSDRRALGQAGIIIVLIKRYRTKIKNSRSQLDKFGLALNDIRVVSRGFVFMKNADDVVDFIKNTSAQLIKKHYRPDKKEQSERAVERGLARSLYEIIKREPMIEVEILDC